MNPKANANVPSIMEKRKRKKSPKANSNVPSIMN